MRTIYAELAQRPLERNCTRLSDCCRFKLTGRTPFVTKGEALVAAQGLRASGRKAVPGAIDGACPALHPRTGACLIYADRPFGCRTHFCVAAGGPADRKSVVDLIHRLEEIDGRLGGDGGRAFPGALAAAMAETPRRGG